MASRKGKNIKTHPDPDAGGFVDPSRTDLTGTSTEEPVVIDLKTNTEEEVNLNARGNEGGDGDGAARQDDDGARPQRRERQPARASEEDGENYGKKVRARLKRERNLLNRERTLREQTNQQLTEERTARQALEARVGSMERKQLDISTNGGVRELEAKITGLKASLGAAIEAGETAKQLDLTIQLGDAQSDLKLLKFKLEQAQADASRRQEQQGSGNQGKPGEAESRQDSPFTQDELASIGDWQESNRHWMKRSKWKDAQEAAVEIDRDLIKDVRAGNVDFDLYSDEHLEELSRRLHDEFPDLPVVDAAGDDYGFEESDDVDRNDGRGDRRNGGRQMNGRGERIGDRDRGGNRGNGTGARPGQGGIGQGGRRQPSQADLARQGKVQLDQADFNQMRTFGMDPNNADHKKAFAKERMRTIITDERNGGGAR